MNIKSTFAFIILAVSAFFFYSFVWEFKTLAVDNISVELTKLKEAYEQATQQLSLKTLRLKKQQLGELEVNFLQKFIPQNLHSGQFVYNLGQLANQNRLTLKGLQYTVVDDKMTNPDGEKKLAIEFTMDGRYEDFMLWLKNIERSEVLIDVEEFRATKQNNSSEIIAFYVKLYAYGINID